MVLPLGFLARGGRGRRAAFVLCAHSEGTQLVCLVCPGRSPPRPLGRSFTHPSTRSSVTGALRECLFVRLFGGGYAHLELTESDDPLDAGLEIMCQPPGKKLSTLSLLSGGEQTLTALALIFAVFLANPAPLCVLAEVDAPLDDANVTRFCDLLDEMNRRTNTRFLIITHHAVTMSRMDRLFGVTMGELGVSQLVSVDLKRAEALVA